MYKRQEEDLESAERRLRTFGFETLIQALPTEDPEEETLGAFQVMVEQMCIRDRTWTMCLTDLILTAVG